ncbi:hypothetical protein MRX96_055872 [Rhipicephalus microplus]
MAAQGTPGVQTSVNRVGGSQPDKQAALSVLQRKGEAASGEKKGFRAPDGGGAKERSDNKEGAASIVDKTPRCVTSRSRRKAVAGGRPCPAAMFSPRERQHTKGRVPSRDKWIRRVTASRRARAGREKMEFPFLPAIMADLMPRPAPGRHYSHSAFSTLFIFY